MKISENQELILGAPGTGKTHTVLNEIDSLLVSGVKPNKIAFVSFTKKAVSEAIDRACAKFDLPKSQFPLFKTVHAMCFSALGIGKKDVMGREHFRELGDWLGYAFEGTWDESEGVPVGSEKGDTLLFLDNLARITEKPLREIWEENYADCTWEELEEFQDKYQEYKSSKFLMDFTDMLSAYISMCDPSSAEYVFVDEAQDLSPLQWRVLQHAFSDVEKTIIAGDDDQSIYRWSGADVNMFLSLGGDKRVLEQSYRLPKSVHKFALNIIENVNNRFEKNYHSREVEGSVDYAVFLEHVELDPNQSTLFLVRNLYLMQQVTSFLEERGIPYFGKHNYPSIKKSHVTAIYAVEKLRKNEQITGKEVKELYECLRVGYYLAHGFKSKIQLVDDNELFTFQKLNQAHGLRDLDVWFTMLQGVNDKAIGYYRAVLANGYSLTHAPNCSISTVHAAKGGEADHVVVLSDMAGRSYAEYEKQPDDERRVAYVAVTRAKEKLTIVEPRGKYYFPYYSEGNR